MKRGLTLLIAALALAVAGASEDLEGLYQQGVQAFQDGRVWEAVEVLGAVAAEDPGYRKVQILLGQANLVADLLRPAQQHFERALLADPNNGHAAFLLGLTLYRGARYAEAAEVLDRAHRLAPANPHPLTYRGRSLLALGRPDEARTEIEAALALAPEESTARLALGELELARGRIGAAEEIVLEVLDTSPRSLDAVILLGRIGLEAGRPEDAVPIFRQALEQAPGRSDLLYLLAQGLLRSGETEAGRAVLRRFRDRKAVEEQVRLLEAAIGAQPDDVEQRLRLARLLLDHGQAGAARLQVAALRRLAPEDPRVEALAEEAEDLFASR